MTNNLFPVSKPKEKKTDAVIVIYLWDKVLEADIPYWIPAWEVVISDPGIVQ